MKNIVLLAAALLLSVTLTACNTVEGAGKDMEKAGT
jgi:predicted small secreted protein